MELLKVLLGLTLQSLPPGVLALIGYLALVSPVVSVPIVFLGLAAIVSVVVMGVQRARWQRWAWMHGGWTLDTASTPLLREFAGARRTRHACRVRVGARAIGVDLAVFRGGCEDAGLEHSYVALVRLPEGAGEHFGDCALARDEYITPIDRIGRFGTRVELESERLHRSSTIRTAGGDPLTWRQLFDPALVDLFADGIDVEFVQKGDELLLHVPAPKRALDDPDTRRIDALCVAAAALEKRFATILGQGRAVPPAPVVEPGADARIEDAERRTDRHVARERARDLSLDPESLFAELARFTSDAEVRSVRARIDSGDFPLEWLDDLVHHRRTAFWGRAEAA